ncbi:Hypothetical_protein [Hexamita inflata]|uniref:Hypothetical_protein n=1 Tax=Hexamita inflata TaxID=28002 RepID=A0AA86TK80_9EUKA|nr:Hypothetical protein HINF_LOCUS7515 [Hexamita inflata]
MNSDLDPISQILFNIQECQVQQAFAYPFAQEKLQQLKELSEQMQEQLKNNELLTTKEIELKDILQQTSNYQVTLFQLQQQLLSVLNKSKASYDELQLITQQNELEEEKDKNLQHYSLKCKQKVDEIEESLRLQQVNHSQNLKITTDQLEKCQQESNELDTEIEQLQQDYKQLNDKYTNIEANQTARLNNLKNSRSSQLEPLRNLVNQQFQEIQNLSKSHEQQLNEINKANSHKMNLNEVQLRITNELTRLQNIQKEREAKLSLAQYQKLVAEQNQSDVFGVDQHAQNVEQQKQAEQQLNKIQADSQLLESELKQIIIKAQNEAELVKTLNEKQNFLQKQIEINQQKIISQTNKSEADQNTELFMLVKNNVAKQHQRLKILQNNDHIHKNEKQLTEDLFQLNLKLYNLKNENSRLQNEAVDNLEIKVIEQKLQKLKNIVGRKK